MSMEGKIKRKGNSYKFNRTKKANEQLNIILVTILRETRISIKLKIAHIFRGYEKKHERLTKRSKIKKEKTLKENSDEN